MDESVFDAEDYYNSRFYTLTETADSWFVSGPECHGSTDIVIDEYSKSAYTIIVDDEFEVPGTGEKYKFFGFNPIAKKEQNA